MLLLDFKYIISRLNKIEIIYKLKTIIYYKYTNNFNRIEFLSSS